MDTADGVIQHQVMLRIIQGIKTKPSPQSSVKTHNMRVPDVRNMSFFAVSISPSAPMWDSPFSISCDVTPQAEGATVQWTLNNMSSIEAIETLQVAPTKNHVLGRASDRLEGNWTCIVGYKGEVGRASVTLTMKGRV